jgi:hypothetical protein
MLWWNLVCVACLPFLIVAECAVVVVAVPVLVLGALCVEVLDVVVPSGAAALILSLEHA